MARLLSIEATGDRGGAESDASHAQRLAPVTQAATTAFAVRIHKDGLMRGSYNATGIAPSRIFIRTDPLSYPLDSRLEVEFVAENNQRSIGYRLPALVNRRSLEGVELKLQPGKAD